MHGFTPIVLLSALAASAFAAIGTAPIGLNKRLVRSHKTVLARRAAAAPELDLLNLLDIGNLVTKLNAATTPILGNITTLLDGVLEGNVTEIVDSVSNELTTIINLVESLLSSSNEMAKQPKSCPAPSKHTSKPKSHPTKKPAHKVPKSKASSSINACGTPAPTSSAHKAKKHPASKKPKATGTGVACRKQPATCETCMTTKEIADILSKVIQEVEVVLTKVDKLVSDLPIVGPILGPLVTKLDGTLGSVLTSVDNLLPGLLDLVCQVLKLVDGLLSKLGLGNLLTGVLGISLKA